jgi:hypothetical protein
MLDTENDMLMASGELVDLPAGSCRSRCTAGVLTDEFYATCLAGYLILYPLNGDKAQIVDFRHFYEGATNCIVGHGDRVFLSFGFWRGNHPRPGTLVQYRISTKETRVLVSTLDPSVEWPLKGMKQPYHILTMAVDEADQRLLTFFHLEPPANPGATYPGRLFGYDWTKNAWSPVSDTLNVCSRSDDWRIFPEGGEIFLMRKSRTKGFGKLNGDGVWELSLCMPDGKLSYNEAKMKRAIGSIYSPRLVRIANLPQGTKALTLHNYRDGIIYSQNHLIFLNRAFAYHFTDGFPAKVVLGDRYVASFRAMSSRTDALRIGILRPLETLKQENGVPK